MTMNTESKPQAAPAELRCEDVMSMLAAYVDGELPPAELEHLEAHVRACSHCETLGGRYASVVRCLHARLTSAEVLAPDIAGRLDQCLRKNLGER